MALKLSQPPARGVNSDASEPSCSETSHVQMAALLPPSAYIIKSGPAMEEREAEQAPEQEQGLINKDY